MEPHNPFTPKADDGIVYVLITGTWDACYKLQRHAWTICISVASSSPIVHRAGTLHLPLLRGLEYQKQEVMLSPAEYGFVDRVQVKVKVA